MSQQFRFFRKNLIDLDYNNVTFTITDSVATSTGTTLTNLMLNRDNESGWSTTGSDDSANTQLDLVFNDVLQFDSIIMTGHNFDNFTIQYYNEGSMTYTDFSTAISPSGLTVDTSFFEFDSVDSSRLRIIIGGTQTADADKFISQLIVTRKIGSGQLEGWPLIKKPTLDLEKKALKTISGKSKIVRSVGAFSCDLDFKTWPSDADMTIIEELHFFHPNGFLFWPSGGDETQFKYKRINFRAKDIFLCGVDSEWQPEWYKGLYKNGVDMKVKLVEVV